MKKGLPTWPLSMGKPRLDTSAIRKWPELGSFPAITNDGNYVLFTLENQPGELVLWNAQTGEEKRWSSVIDYSFSENGNILLLKAESKTKEVSLRSLQWIGLTETYPITIWEGPENYSVITQRFDENGKQLVFIVQRKDQENTQNTIWYYQTGMNKAIVLVDDSTEGMGGGLSINNRFPQFSKNGNWIFFNLQKTEQIGRASCRERL